MNNSSECLAEPGAADQFVSRLRSLTSWQLATLARRLEEARATPAGDIEWWRATAAVSRRLRHLHRSRAAAIAALRASEAVLAARGASELPRDAVVHAARAAGDLARVLVASGPPFALNVFTAGWENVLKATPPPPPPTGARTAGDQISMMSADRIRAWARSDGTVAARRQGPLRVRGSGRHPSAGDGRLFGGRTHQPMSRARRIVALAARRETHPGHR
jgi:hypothetical protein